MDERIEYRAEVDYGDMVRRICEQVGRRIDEQAVEQVRGRLAELGYRKCSECTERQGYYMDAETIQRQQEHIDKLKALNGELCAEINEEATGRIERDELIRDMWAGIVREHPQGGFPDMGLMEQRMRELGIEVG